MGRNPIIRNAILQLLSLHQDRKLRFKKIQEGTAELLKRKSINPKSITKALLWLLEKGYVEKTLNEKGQIVYGLTKKYFEKQLKDMLNRLIEKQRNSDLFYRLNDEKDPPTVFFTKIPKEQGSIIYFDPYLINWSDPSDIIARRMTEAMNEWEKPEYAKKGVKEGVTRLLAYAYWCGVQRMIRSYGFKPLPKVIDERRKFAKGCLERFGKVDPQRAKVERAIIQILDLTEELISKPNLKEFLDLLSKKTIEVKKLQRQILNIEHHFMSAGEKIWDYFLNLHMVILTGLELTNVKIGNKFFKHHSEVWNAFIRYLMSDTNKFSEVHGSLEDNLAKLNIYGKDFIRYLEELPRKSQILITYVWGFDDISKISEETFLPDFESWFSALKQGNLDDHTWLFEEQTKLELIKAIRRVKRRRNPDPIKIDFVNWTLKDLYEYHPRGKELKFWEDLLNELEKRKHAEMSFM